MKRETIAYKTEAEWLALRTQDLTSTEVAALFGLSPYTTHAELWHRKKSGTQPEVKVTERMMWGSRLEAAIADGIATDKNWNVSPMKVYMRLPERRVGASFDYSIDGFLKPDGTTQAASGILEIKNVDASQLREKWIINDDGTFEAAAHIEIQLQVQLLVSGRKVGFIGALVGGNQVLVGKRIADPEIQNEILRRAAEFWLSIDLNQPPAFDFERDAEFIKRLYSHAEPGKVMTATARLDELAEQYNDVSQMLKQLEARRDAVKAEMLTILGESEKVLGSNYTITAGMVGPSRVEYDRAGYRTFKVSFKKTKENKG